MFNTEIIYTAMKSSFRGDIEKINTWCLVCGKEIDEGIATDKVLAQTFTNLTECNCLESKYVCKECTFCIKDPNLRRNNIICDKENIYFLKKNDLENYLFNLEKYLTEREFLVAITTSFKKHNTFRCRVNLDYKRFYIREEDNEYLFDVEKLKNLYDILNEAYLSFSKEELQSGDYKFISIENYGLEKFKILEDILRKHRGSHQFNLLIYMLNAEKRNKLLKAKIKKEKELKKIKKQNNNKKENKNA